MSFPLVNRSVVEISQAVEKGSYFLHVEEEGVELVSVAKDVFDALSRDERCQVARDLSGLLWKVGGNEAIEKCRNEILFSAKPEIGQFDFGILRLTEDELDAVDEEELFQFLRSGVSELWIGDICYSEFVLRKLAPNKNDLTDMYTLAFGEKKHQIPKAKLLLCGEMIRAHIDIPFLDATQKVISFKDLSKEGFEAVLHHLETGDVSPSLSIDVCNFLEYIPIPKDALGPSQLKEHFNIEVTCVPQIPENLLMNQAEFLLVLVPKGLTLNDLKKLGIEVGLTKGLDGYPDKLLKRDGKIPVAETQWIGFKRGGLLPKSRKCKTYDGYMNLVQKQGLDAPFVLEHALAEILLYAEGREPLVSRDEKGGWIWGFCQDDLIERNYVNVCGACCPAGPDFNFYWPNDYRIGVLGVLRK